MTHLSSPPSDTRNGRFGFTLIELMVVILIISILSGIVLTAMTGSDPGQSLDAGSSRMSSLFSLARSAAITRKTRTRVLVNYDNTDTDNFLRTAFIAYYDDTDSKWKVYSDLESLPQGVYFSTGHSMKSDATLKMWEATLSSNYVLTPTSDELIDAPSSPSPAAGSWFAYEYNSNGTFSNPGARVVLAYGVLAGNELIVNPETEDTLLDGFVVFRAGRPMYFQDPRQITE